jgi:hypothetical protein
MMKEAKAMMSVLIVKWPRVFLRQARLEIPATGDPCVLVTS